MKGSMTGLQKLTPEKQKDLNAALTDASFKQCSINTLATLLAAGANVDAGIDVDNKMTILMHAARDNDKGKAILALQNGANLDAKNAQGRTPLIIAAKNGSKQTLDVLLAAGAYLDSVDKDGKKAADFAYEQGHNDLVEYLEDVTAGRTPRPTPEKVGLDMNKRAQALSKIETLEKHSNSTVTGTESSIDKQNANVAGVTEIQPVNQLGQFSIDMNAKAAVKGTQR
jgi:ankyrin repeat protein